MATNVSVILAPRADSMSPMPVPEMAYSGMEKISVGVAVRSTIPANAGDYWFIWPKDADIRVLQCPAVGGTDVTTTTGWPVKAGVMFAARAIPGYLLSMILDA